MAWITRLSESDYRVSMRLATHVIISDDRNRHSYRLSADAVQFIIRLIGLQQPDKLWIATAIQLGYIPHPYDEYI
ncbi:hypothetical protein [Spirosoma rhododendri]|uniref:Uncharacterized protein n=1 Tax=Spirosoma rhododendri TaxID=2728024 RepID=A0A7L5DN35_9BACT|nr:hypothetical protein [Spirosoma rhododendri]QJD79515.1 hypothetical protein HH216_14685 [Spirosoma rhododendri]